MSNKNIQIKFKKVTSLLNKQLKKFLNILIDINFEK
jgi:hypothetical protein